MERYNRVTLSYWKTGAPIAMAVKEIFHIFLMHGRPSKSRRRVPFLPRGETTENNLTLPLTRARIKFKFPSPRL